MTRIDYLFVITFYFSGVALLLWAQTLNSTGGALFCMVSGAVLAMTAHANLKLPDLD